MGRTPPPLLARDVQDLRAALAGRAGPVALVPTMGALHEGHLALVRAAREQAGVVVASIFVNPAQFGPGEDLESYPRDEAGDLEALASVSCDIAYLPTATVMYPPGDQTRVRPGALAQAMDGAARPGHFEGVCTVVAKLFGQVRPDLALFGEKDFQQLAVIRRMREDLHLWPEIVGVPTVREPDGLAMSSRNRYLSASERTLAGVLPRTLRDAARRLLAGVPSEAVLTGGLDALRQAGFVPDYLDLRRADDLTALPAGPVPAAVLEDARLFVAARLGATRLIDNLSLHEATSLTREHDRILAT